MAGNMKHIVWKITIKHPGKNLKKLIKIKINKYKFLSRERRKTYETSLAQQLDNLAF